MGCTTVEEYSSCKYAAFLKLRGVDHEICLGCKNGSKLQPKPTVRVCEECAWDEHEYWLENKGRSVCNICHKADYWLPLERKKLTKRCKHIEPTHRNLTDTRCTNKSTKDGYCTSCHPDTVARKAEEKRKEFLKTLCPTCRGSGRRAKEKE